MWFRARLQGVTLKSAKPITVSGSAHDRKVIYLLLLTILINKKIKKKEKTKRISLKNEYSNQIKQHKTKLLHSPHAISRTNNV